MFPFNRTTPRLPPTIGAPCSISLLLLNQWIIQHRLNEASIPWARTNKFQAIGDTTSVPIRHQSSCRVSKRSPLPMDETTPNWWASLRWITSICRKSHSSGNRLNPNQTVCQIDQEIPENTHSLANLRMHRIYGRTTASRWISSKKLAMDTRQTCVLMKGILWVTEQQWIHAHNKEWSAPHALEHL